MFVKPTANPDQPETLHKVRYPDGARTFLSEEGAEVPENTYWLRRLNHGDIEVCDPPKPPAPEAVDEAPPSDKTEPRE